MTVKRRTLQWFDHVIRQSGRPAEDLSVQQQGSDCRVHLKIAHDSTKSNNMADSVWCSAVAVYGLNRARLYSRSFDVMTISADNLPGTCAR